MSNEYEIKPDLDVSTDDFWYDLFDGGYLKPALILKSIEDVDEVDKAIKVLKRFRDACISNIEGFIR